MSSTLALRTADQLRPAPATVQLPRRSRPPGALALLVSVAGAALMVVAIPGVNPSQEGTAGLISAVGPVYLTGMTLLSVGFVIGLARGGPRWLPGAPVVTLVVLVVAVGALIEPDPRLAVTYTHLGFARYIATHGRSLPPIDAHAGWPGVFALIAELETVMHDPTGFAIGRWAPLVFDLLAIAPLYVLASVATADRRARWLALWIFFTAYWVEQDYLSPQAVDFTLYLIVLGVLLARFGPLGPLARNGRLRITRTWRTWRSRFFEPAWVPSTSTETGAVDGAHRRAGVLVLVVVIAAAMVVSHQLTPYVLLLDAVVLVAIGRCRLGAMPWLLGLMTVGWLSFGASSFWTGHLSLLTGSAGHVAGNVTSGVSDRIHGDPGHLLVITARIVMVLGVALAAAVGWLRQRARGTDQPWVAALAVAPVLLVGAQSYGGEVVIRVFLFSLPFLAVSAAAAVFPGRAVPALVGGPRLSTRVEHRVRSGWLNTVVYNPAGRMRPTVLVLAGLLAAGASLLGMLAHYGSDQFDQVPAGELAAVAWFYAHVAPPATAFTVCTNLPWRWRGAVAYRYESLPTVDDTHAGDALGRLESTAHGAYFIATTSQAICGVEDLGLPSGWLTALEGGLQRSGDAQVIYDHGGARIYHFTAISPSTSGGTT